MTGGLVRIAFSFVLMAVLFGGGTEVAGLLFEGHTLSLRSAAIRGIFFSTVMSAFLYWQFRNGRLGSAE